MRHPVVSVLVMLFAAGLAAPAVSARQAAQADSPRRAEAPTKSIDAPRLRGFVVTLAQGNVEPGSMEGNLTPAAMRALTDIKNFLPYKSYRALDTVWLIGLNGPHQRLKGTDGRIHEFYMRSTVSTPDVITVDLLRLWDAVPTDSNTKVVPPVLIDTSFKITIGETVVVGVSRLDGDKGLVVLVTAAAK